MKKKFSAIFLADINQITKGVLEKPFKSTENCFFIYDALFDFVPFVQFKKREKHPWRNVTFSNVVSNPQLY